MKRPLKAEEQRLWAVVAATVRPVEGRSLPERISEQRSAPAPLIPAQAWTQTDHQPPLKPRRGPGLRGDERKVEAIEPLRKRRLARGRDEIEARLDLHGLDQDRARTALHAFLRNAHDRGFRAVLVITGKGALGDGVLRRRAPDWLAEPTVRPLIAGVSPAIRRHGGEGALYIALKRRT